MPHLVFQLEDHAFAIPVSAVRQIIRAVEVTSVPNGPPFLVGVINLHGNMIPVFDIRKQLDLPPNPIRVSDRIIVLEVAARPVCFISDEIDGIIELNPETAQDASTIYPEMANYLRGVAKKDDRTVLIYDIGKLFPSHIVQAMAVTIEQIGDIEKTT